MYQSGETWWFMQNVNLIFHEAGHVLMTLFGRILMLLGGTIFEIGIPLLVAVYFFLKRQYFSASVTLWWTSTALLSVSIYASDARERLLPLITGDRATHDWFQILGHYNLLEYDDTVGNIFFFLGSLTLGLMTVVLYFDRDVRNLLHRYTLR